MSKKSSTSEKLTYLFQSTRPFNLVMIAAGILITLYVGLQAVAPFDIMIPAIVAAVLIAAGGNSINDYYDVDIDIVNRPDKPLPSGKIKPNELWTFSILLFVGGILTSLLLPFLCIVLAVVNSILLGLYASKIKRSGFFGNILISYLVASVFAFGGAAIHKLLIGIFLAIVAFFTNAAREILKDMEDIKGDEMFGAKTFPMLEGRKKSIVIIVSFLIVAILISPIPYLLGILSLYYMIFAIITDLIFVYAIYSITQSSALKVIKLNQKRIKIAAIIGLMAFLAGTIPFPL